MILFKPLTQLGRRGSFTPRPLHQTPHHCSQDTPTRNPFKRAARYIKNDPFARVSLVFGGTVLVVLLVIESFIPKDRRKIRPQVAILPPHVTHATIQRERELNSLLSAIPSMLSLKPAIAVVTGPTGSGKTELSWQFTSRFIKASAPLFSRKESSKPIVICLDATRPHLLEQSIQYAAAALKMSSSQLDDSQQSPLDALVTKLGEQKARWLLVIDGVQNETTSLITEFVKGVAAKRSLRKGYILITSPNEEMSSSSINHVSLAKGLSLSEANDLFYKLAGTFPCAPPTNQKVNELLSALCDTPLSVALAALTTRLYHYCCETNEENDPSQLIANYHEMLNESCGSHMTDKITDLYIEALSSVDNYFLHSIDFISLCDLLEPLPTSVIKQHLKNPFYKLPSSPSSSVFEDTPTATPTLEPTPAVQSYFSLLKSKIPFIGGTSPQTPPLYSTEPGQSSDALSSLRLSPFVHTQNRNNQELLTFQSGLKERLANHFLRYTVPKIETEYLKAEEQRWNNSAWFKRFRSFDSQSSLDKFHRNLPGLITGQVYTKSDWSKQQNNSSPLDTTSYSDYIHWISHIHRSTQSVSLELKYLSRDPDDLALRRYLRPHLLSVSSQRSLTEQDQLKCEANLLSIDSCFSLDKDAFYKRYSSLVQSMKESYGTGHCEVANILTAMAELQYFSGRYQLAEELLLSAIDIHEGAGPVHSRSFTQNMDLASTLATLGLTYASLEEGQKCRETLERALGLFQTLPSDGDIPKKQRRLVATTVTDLGHAYVATGDLVAAKRYLDLALAAQRSIHGDDHPEIARTLNVLSIVYSLTGDNEQSRQSRKEAGKIQQELKTMSNIV